VISKFKLPQATICAALEHWLRSLDKQPDFAHAKVISVRLKSVNSGEFEAYVETARKPKRGPQPGEKRRESLGAIADGP
jgi:hypothetical protein